ncbi:MAG: restriction endonuclease subunit S [Campylobacteraceae bacterium]|jgi:restriction endonuclease S subunit|nr:restriction endonuclease subunit S [Campylobacteraceae bacterium]
MKIKELFSIIKPKPLELINTTKLNPSVNFVSRTGENNGVSDCVDAINDFAPYSAGCITIALGGSVLSAFVQNKDFYVSFHVAILIPKKRMTLLEKLYYCCVISHNKYRYNYGRQANRTLGNIELPDKIPEWIYKIDLKEYSSLITSAVKVKKMDISIENWKYFKLSDLFEINPGKFYYSDEYNNGSVHYVSATNTNNGISKCIDLAPDFNKNSITIGKIGCTTFYQNRGFCATSDVTILSNNNILNKYIGLFLSTIINKENYRWNYGRQIRLNNCKKMMIKLPSAIDGNPDWQFMEDYIKQLPYTDKI